MPTAMEQRLDRMVHELNEIKKEVILQKIHKVSAKAGKIDRWKSLGGGSPQGGIMFLPLRK